MGHRRSIDADFLIIDALIAIDVDLAQAETYRLIFDSRGRA